MERDFSIRFSDEVYASKDEVKKALNISSIDSIWERINSYRSYFKRNLDLVSIEEKMFSVCFTIPLQHRIVSLEKKMTQDMITLSRMNDSSFNEFINQCLFVIGKSYAEQDSLTISDDTLNKLIGDLPYEVPQVYMTLKNYLLTIKQYLKKSVNKYDLSILTSFYGKILRKDINYLDLESYIRIADLNNPADHVFFGRHYNAAPIEKIEVLLKDLMNFNQKNTFAIIRSIVTYFYLIYIKPFEYFNEECSLLSLKYIIAQDNISFVPFLLNIEKRLLNTNLESFKEKFELSELSQDLTYFINYILDIIEEALSEFKEMIVTRDISQIKQESLQADELFPPQENKTFVQAELPFVNRTPLVFEQKVSMPTLPTGLDAKDIDLIADNLLELYPSLKYNQARFYASHCTIGKYYSIAQYKKETGVAYETARTSMDNLVTLGFYKKEQIKNKYVYTPVVR